MKQFRFISALALALVLMIGFNACKKVKDADLKTSIEQKFVANPDLKDVMVDVQKGIATLTGQVKDDATNTAAINMAKEVKGVKQVMSNITIAPPQPLVSDADATMQAALKDALKDNSGVVYEVKDGVVTLTGEVKKSDLPKLMQKVSALKPTKIENKLTIK